jgi:hypothetical protein
MRKDVEENFISFTQEILNNWRTSLILRQQLGRSIKSCPAER